MLFVKVVKQRPSKLKVATTGSSAFNGPLGQDGPDQITSAKVEDSDNVKTVSQTALVARFQSTSSLARVTAWRLSTLPINQLAVSAFICWILYLANNEQKNFRILSEYRTWWKCYNFWYSTGQNEYAWRRNQRYFFEAYAMLSWSSGLPQRSPFVRTDCTVKHDGELYVVGAVKGVEQMSLYKTDREDRDAKMSHKSQFLSNKSISEIFIQLDAHRARHVKTWFWNFQNFGKKWPFCHTAKKDFKMA